MQLDAKYNPKDIEDAIYTFWVDNKYFSAQINPQKNPFTIVIPPPNVTGILHMGHALNNTIQDVIIRFKRMQGFEALWMPGTDHAGIATQNVVEKQLAKEGLRKEDIGREEFNKKLWQWRNKYGSTIIEQLKKIGASCDWERTRFTMDDEYSEAVKEAFVRLYNKGLIYQGNYIINWCPRCKTALSDEESPHSDIEGYLYYIRYPIKNYNAESSSDYSTDSTDKKNYIVVATTRPETMLGDTAVAINPKDERYRHLKGREVILPIVNRTLRVIEDEAVDPEFGTGIVKVTPAHDPVDFALGKKYNLDFINIMNDDATLNENAGEFEGMDRFKAREAIIERLKKDNLIEKIDSYNVRAGRCYRCNTIIEPRLSKQWFVRMKPLAKKAIEAVESGEIKFYPLRWKKVYLNWMNNIQDWCISRQIWWGHRLPVFYCRNCQTQASGSKPQSAGLNSEACSADTAKGVIVSKTKPDKCPVCGSSDIYQEDDVLDTWFSSWLWPFASLYWPFVDSEYRDKNAQSESHNLQQEEFNYFYPTDVLVTASEILFFWVARMIMASFEFTGRAPFHTVLIHGTVRDDKGIKMSKSLGNTIDPLEIIDKFGADALRFSLMMLASTGSDVYLSDEKFLVGRNFANKIWNASRFIINKADILGIKIDDLNITEADGSDCWIVNKLNNTIYEVTDCLNNYRINDAVKEVYDFFWHTFCDWYIEIVKNNFTESKAKILLLCLISSLKLIHPVMPFITEEIFQIINEKFLMLEDESLVKSKWPDKVSIECNPGGIEEVEFLIDLIKGIRNLKVDLGIVPSKKIKAFIKTDEGKVSVLKRNMEWVIRLSNIEGVEFKDSLSRILFKNDYLDLDFALDDFDAKSYILSLNNKIKKLNVFLERSLRKLRNESFLSKAPRETIDKEKDKYESGMADASRLKKLRDALSGQ